MEAYLFDSPEGLMKPIVMGVPCLLGQSSDELSVTRRFSTSTGITAPSWGAYGSRKDGHTLRYARYSL